MILLRRRWQKRPALTCASSCAKKAYSPGCTKGWLLTAHFKKANTDRATGRFEIAESCLLISAVGKACRARGQHRAPRRRASYARAAPARRGRRRARGTCKERHERQLSTPLKVAAASCNSAHGRGAMEDSHSVHRIKS
eukprot:4144669-Pleurochrysis_carterae.AAC.5